MPQRRAINLLLLFFALLFVVLAAASLRWSHLHDAAVLLYTGMCVERFGMVPYRDFFDINMPGAHLAFAALGRLAGYGDLAFRLADLSCLAALLALTWAWMRRLDRRAALAGPLVFALAYLGGGEVASLQRDFLILLPIAAALLAVAQASCLPLDSGAPPSGGIPAKAGTPERWHPLACGLGDCPKRSAWTVPEAVRPLACGLGFGLAATIKPHAAIGLFPVLIYLWKPTTHNSQPTTHNPQSHRPRAVLFALLGFAVPPAAIFAWLAACGALPEFLDLALHYWPLYGAMTGGHFPVRGLDRLTYLGEEFQKLGGLGPWLLPATLGLTLFLVHPALTPARRRLAALLAGLAAVYALYPALTGQFWSYHWLPLLYFLTQAGALCLSDPVLDAPGAARRVLPLIYLPLTIALLLMQPAMQPWSRYKYQPPDNPARAALIGDFLKARLGPADTVQVLDWCAGGIHGALRAGARPATRFIYDFHFYHDVSSPVVQRLRARLIAELNRSRPRFIVQTVGDRPFPQGRDASTRFEALEAFIQSNYHLAFQGPGFLIYEKKASFTG